jgi:SAM-dependent methyltransferase
MSKTSCSEGDFVDKLSRLMRPYIATTALNTVWTSFDKNAESVLDVGCGRGEPMRFINGARGRYTVGLDIFKPYLKECKRNEIHDDYVLCDIGKLPLTERSFDVVLCMEVIEHLKRLHGEQLVESLEKTARKQIVITAPVGKYKQSAYEGNSHQEHESIWSSMEFGRLGYKVRGVGIRNFGGEEGLVSHLPKWWRFLTHMIWVLMGLFTYYCPTMAGHIVCTKNLCLRDARS